MTPTASRLEEAMLYSLRHQSGPLAAVAALALLLLIFAPDASAQSRSRPSTGSRSERSDTSKKEEKAEPTSRRSTRSSQGQSNRERGSDASGRSNAPSDSKASPERSARQPVTRSSTSPSEASSRDGRSRSEASSRDTSGRASSRSSDSRTSDDDQAGRSIDRGTVARQNTTRSPRSGISSSPPPGTRGATTDRSRSADPDATRVRFRTRNSQAAAPERRVPNRRNDDRYDHRRPRYQRPVYYPRHKQHRRYKPQIIVRPVYVDFDWPWEHRYRTGWRPRYQYRQVVYYDTRWERRHRQERIDVRTEYYHVLRSASRDRAIIDIYLDRIDLYQNGRYLGNITHIPEHLSRIRATVYRDGYVDFDRNVFVVGDARRGLELLSTRYYDGYVLGAYEASHGLRVGEIDLRRGTVHPVRYSRLFDPNRYTGYAPVSLLPDDHGWLFDYGFGSFSGAYYDADPYYYGGYFNDEYYEDDVYDYDAYGSDGASYKVAPLTNRYDEDYRTASGATVHFQRETELVRLE